MHEYHSWMSLDTAAVVSTTLVQPAPAAEENSCPTQFKCGTSVHTNNPSPEEFSVEAEYRKYASGEVSSAVTDILWFWEVRSFQLNDAMAHSLNRRIRMSFRPCSRLPWTISLSRQHLYLVSVCSPQRRRQTQINETGWARYLWRLFNYLNFPSRRNASTSQMDGWHRKWPCLGCPKPTHDLGSLFVDNSDGVMDSILKECIAYNDWFHSFVLLCTFQCHVVLPCHVCWKLLI